MGVRVRGGGEEGEKSDEKVQERVGVEVELRVGVGERES